MQSERAVRPLLLGFAPDGVCRAAFVAIGAVVSYAAVSPLPVRTGGLFSVALSIRVCLNKLKKTLSGR